MLLSLKELDKQQREFRRQVQEDLKSIRLAFDVQGSSPPHKAISPHKADVEGSLSPRNKNGFARSGKALHIPKELTYSPKEMSQNGEMKEVTVKAMAAPGVYATDLGKGMEVGGGGARGRPTAVSRAKENSIQWTNEAKATVFEATFEV